MSKYNVDDFIKEQIDDDDDFLNVSNKPPLEPASYFDSFLEGAQQGASFGFADELKARLKSGDYDQNILYERNKLHNASDTNPISYWLGDVAGSLGVGLATGGLGATARGASLAMKAKNALNVGNKSLRLGLMAGGGSLAGVGMSEADNVSGVAGDAVIGGALGLGGGMLGDKIGSVIEKGLKSKTAKSIDTFNKNLRPKIKNYLESRNVGIGEPKRGTPERMLGNNFTGSADLISRQLKKDLTDERYTLAKDILKNDRDSLMQDVSDFRNKDKVLTAIHNYKKNVLEPMYQEEIDDLGRFRSNITDPTVYNKQVFAEEAANKWGGTPKRFLNLFEESPHKIQEFDTAWRKDRLKKMIDETVQSKIDPFGDPITQKAYSKTADQIKDAIDGMPTDDKFYQVFRGARDSVRDRISKAQQNKIAVPEALTAKSDMLESIAKDFTHMINQEIQEKKLRQAFGNEMYDKFKSENKMGELIEKGQAIGIEDAEFSKLGKRYQNLIEAEDRVAKSIANEKVKGTRDKDQVQSMTVIDAIKKGLDKLGWNGDNYDNIIYQLKGKPDKVLENIQTRINRVSEAKVPKSIKKGLMDQIIYSMLTDDDQE